MSRWEKIDNELFKKLFDFVPKEFQTLVSHVYAQQVCNITDLLERFPEHGTSPAAFLAAIGKVNGKLFSRFNCAIYPKEVGAGDCYFSLGWLETQSQ